MTKVIAQYTHIRKTEWYRGNLRKLSWECIGSYEHETYGSIQYRTDIGGSLEVPMWVRVEG